MTLRANTQDGRNRVGTDIIARGLKVKIMFISNVDRPNLNVHCYLFKYNTTAFGMTILSSGQALSALEPILIAYWTTQIVIACKLLKSSLCKIA